jgi:hypothetical protein
MNFIASQTRDDLHVNMTVESISILFTGYGTCLHCESKGSQL